MAWQIIGDSVRGASHQRNDKPNQDAWSSLNIKNAQCVAVAVADGHGSSRHYRSDKGAELAVHAALALLNEFANKHSKTYDVRQLKQATDYLPNQLVQSWRNAVDIADDNHILSAKERYSTYGTTVLAVLLAEHYAIYLQIGDGDLLVLNEQGQLYYPLAKSTQLLANETHSLCEDQAIYHIELGLQFFEHHPPPVLIFLATDGYANSFHDTCHFQQAVLDFQQQLLTHGADKIQACLADWLHETSELGSGDDVTLALLWSGLACQLPSVEDLPAMECHAVPDIT